ncbi:ATP-dependent DNA helicase PIF1, partial [Trifolium pratense]
ESIWRIFAYKIHFRWPPVTRLTFHTQGNQRVVFNDSSNLEKVLKSNSEKGTMFLAWMAANRQYPQGRHLTYAQFPTLFTYDSDGRFWKPRKSGGSVGRLTYIPHGSRELFYLRLLLTAQVGCTSFEDLRTVNGHVHDSFREACADLRLLEDDQDFINAIVEVANIGSGYSIRKMFSCFLMSNSMSDPFNVWEQLWEILADGILYQKRRELNLPGELLSLNSLFMLF